MRRASELTSTPRARSDEEARLFRLLVDRVVDYAIFLLTPDGRIASWNAGARRLKGYEASDIIGHSFEQFYTPEARAAGLPAQLLAAARADGRVEDEGWRVRKDGSRFWADVVITALFDDDGTLRGFAKVTRDMTERREIDGQLRQSEQRFRALVSSIKEYAIFMLSPEGIVLTWNAGAEYMKGYAPNEIIGQSFEQFYTPGDRIAHHPAQLLASARENGRVEEESWRVRKDGTLFWADVVITALHDDSGVLVGYAKVTRDLTERRQAERERANRQAAERAAERIGRLQDATVALAAASEPMRVAEVLAEMAVSALSAAAGMVALSPTEGADVERAYVLGAEESGLDPRAAFGLDVPNPHVEPWASGKPVFIESRATLPADHPELAPMLSSSPHGAWAFVPLLIERHVHGLLGLSFAQARTFDDEAHGLILALAEVGAQALDRATAYERERRARAEAEAAVRTQDEFISIASHELRTPVATVKATAQLAERALRRGEVDVDRTLRYLDIIARSADRLTSLVDDLLDISRLRTGQVQMRRQSVNLEALVQDIVARHRTMEAGAVFEVASPNIEMLVDADPLRLEQVVDNLLNNALKYSPQGGEIRVVVEREAAGVAVHVIDRGIGLAPGQETRIFEPFGRAPNATAQQIPGLGLGLAICQQLIEAHGGRIWAESPGEHQGTTVSFWLPSAIGVE